MSLHGDHEGGAALQMALAAALHHSRDVGPVTYNALRSQKTARAEATCDATTSVAGDTEFFSLYEEELGGTRPDRLYEVRPQERDQRRTVEQNVDTALFLPSLDVPVPQMANQLLEVCRQLDTPIPEQVIEVPKISSSRQSHRRRVRFAEQTAEQLVEVPTIISYSSLRGIVEQNVDIPAPLGRGRLHLVEQIIVQGLPSKSLTFQLRVVAKIFLLQRRLAHPRRRLSWRASSLLRTTMCGCSFLLDNGCCLARTRMSSAMSPVKGLSWVLWLVTCLWPCSDIFQQSSSNSGWCFTVPRQIGGYCRYATETGTHSFKLCIMDWIDMSVVVHVKVVDNPVTAQRPFLSVQFSRPLRFPSCSPLIRCSMSLLRKFSSFLGCRP